jgi:ribose transport system substrate-binding protein
MTTRRSIVRTTAPFAVLALATVAGATGAAAGTEPSDTAAAGGGAVDPAVCQNEITDIAIVSPYYSDQPATKEVVDAFTGDAEAAGFNVTMVDTRGDLAAVNSEMENALAQGADAIVLGMGDPLEFGAGLAATTSAQIPVFGLDAGAADGITANITSDNEFLGETSAQVMIDAIGGEGRIVIIHFDPFEPVRLRAQAARALFEEAGIEIIEDIQGDPADSTGFAKTTVQDLLSKYPEGEIDGIWVAWDASALGAFQATQETGRTEVIVTGVDGQDFAVAEVAKGENWVATVRQDWPGIAATAVETIEACSAGEAPASQIITVEGELITAETAAGESGSSDATDSSDAADTVASDSSETSES